MLFEEFMQLKAESVETHIDKCFENGRLERQDLKTKATKPLEHVEDYRKVAMWFERYHNDDLTKDEYDISIGTFESNFHPHQFIHTLVLDQRGEARSTIKRNRDGYHEEVPVIVFYEEGETIE